MNLLLYQDLLLSKLYFIDLEEALPGSLLPILNDEPILFNNRRITPLLPLKPAVLDYLTPEELVSRIKFQPQKTPEGMKVCLTLTLQLSDNKGKPEPYIMQKDYLLKEENSLGDQLPVLQIWPNFRAEGWKEYYTFYYDAELGEETFNASFPDVRQFHNFKEDLGNYQINRLEAFPKYIECLDSENNLLGLILLKTPKEIDTFKSYAKNWKVGVSFDEKYTNIYINSKDIQMPEPLNLENLQLQVTNTARDTRINLLFENFIPEGFIPQEKPLPLSSILTTKGSNPNTEKMLPILDGRFYVPDNRRFGFEEKWIKTDLKWSKENLPFNELFLKHIALHIAALAANAGIKEIQWSLSYPSAFSRNDRNTYAQVWKNLIEELKKTTGIEQHHPERDSENLKTESLAFAQYFADFEGHNLVYTTCIYVLDKISDISIWENNQQIHQCTVSLGTRDLFHQFLDMNPKFIEQQFKEDSKYWKGLSKKGFNTKLDAWLCLDSDNWLKSQRTLLQDSEDLQGLIQLTAIGIAGLYYYIGILLKVLNQEGKYSRSKITPVYIGGYGSHFLKWLDERGKFDRDSEMNKLFSRMLSVGSGFEDTEQLTRLSQHPADEVACGLILSKTKLHELPVKEKSYPIAGENYLVSGKEYNSESRIQLEEYNTDFQVPQLVELVKFLNEFHRALGDLGIEAIKPLPDYSPNQNQQLWKATQQELDDIFLKLKKKPKNFPIEPPFILGLKALLRVLGKKWAI